MLWPQLSLITEALQYSSLLSDTAKKHNVLSSIMINMEKDNIF